MAHGSQTVLVVDADEPHQGSPDRLELEADRLRQGSPDRLELAVPGRTGGPQAAAWRAADGVLRHLIFDGCIQSPWAP